jgi:hypothetical protein
VPVTLPDVGAGIFWGIGEGALGETLGLTLKNVLKGDVDGVEGFHFVERLRGL